MVRGCRLFCFSAPTLTSDVQCARDRGVIRVNVRDIQRPFESETETGNKERERERVREREREKRDT